jgi:formamidopyrimidine-DNA glycosylase
LPLDRHTLLVHLGMTGQITVRDPGIPDEPFEVQPVTGLQRTSQHPIDNHTHIVLDFEDGRQLMYRDIRKFGKWRLYRPGELAKAPELARLGPDPFTPAYRLEDFQAGLKRTRRAVKAALLDQGLVAGVGNIYADEALFLAGIRPSRRGTTLTKAEIGRLFGTVKYVLELGIKNRGTTFSNYRDASGESGSNQTSLQAYGRYGEACYKCGAELQRSTVGQRTTTWCPKCQR